MFGFFAVDEGFLCNVHGCLESMTRKTQQLNIAFAIFAAANKRYNMVISRQKAATDRQPTIVTSSFSPLEYPDANPWRNCRIIGGADPFW
jgi:hypothetical protein